MLNSSLFLQILVIITCSVCVQVVIQDQELDQMVVSVPLVHMWIYVRTNHVYMVPVSVIQMVPFIVFVKLVTLVSISNYLYEIIK